MTVCGWKLLSWLSWYFSFLVILVSACLFLLILLHGFLCYKILYFYMIPFHIFTSYISFPYSQIYLHSKISSGVKTPSFNCLFSGFYCWMPHGYLKLIICESELFVLPFQFSVSTYCTFQWMYYYPCSPSNWKHGRYLKFFFVDPYLKTEIITISVFIDHLCCTSIVLNVYI